MKHNAPVISQLKVLSFEEHCDEELDSELLEIEEAKKHFENHADSEAFWAGRLLADRKSSRIAA